MNVLVIFTCYNRKEKTENCTRTLAALNPKVSFTYIIVDDNSSDGTGIMLRELSGEYDIDIIHGSGGLFYSGGMRLGMEHALRSMHKDFDYLLMCNDDVDFIDGSIEKMMEQSRMQESAIIAGVTCDNEGNITYGAMKRNGGVKFRRLSLEEWKVEADTFNANAVLIPYHAFTDTGVIDSHFKHTLGDFDYGLMLKKKGYKIYGSKEYVGVCLNNPVSGTWNDRTLSRIERIKRKESVKGAPTKQWFYFLKKNFGLLYAVRGCITPYIRILAGR